MCITFIDTCTGLSLGVQIFISNSILQMIKIIVNAAQKPKEIGWIRTGQQNGPKLSESNILLLRGGVSPPSKGFPGDA